MKNFRQKYRPKKSSLVIGRNAVKEAIESGRQLDRIYLLNTIHGKPVEEIKSLALGHDIPISKVPLEK
ncbi:MAG: RNA methyltransferase substrate-binding domain-containing protein, partial [Chitinophagales bacterium]